MNPDFSFFLPREYPFTNEVLTYNTYFAPPTSQAKVVDISPPSVDDR